MQDYAGARQWCDENGNGLLALTYKADVTEIADTLSCEGTLLLKHRSTSQNFMIYVVLRI